LPAQPKQLPPPQSWQEAARAWAGQPGQTTLQPTVSTATAAEWRRPRWKRQRLVRQRTACQLLRAGRLQRRPPPLPLAQSAQSTATLRRHHQGHGRRHAAMHRPGVTTQCAALTSPRPLAAPERRLIRDLRWRRRRHRPRRLSHHPPQPDASCRCRHLQRTPGNPPAQRTRPLPRPCPASSALPPPLRSSPRRTPCGPVRALVHTQAPAQTNSRPVAPTIDRPAAKPANALLGRWSRSQRRPQRRFRLLQHGGTRESSEITPEIDFAIERWSGVSRRAMPTIEQIEGD
jgi:hypothetical protein